MRICFDLDNTLCCGVPYYEAVPVPGASQLLRELRRQGHTVIIQTARGMGSSDGNPGKAIAQEGAQVFEQLDAWGFEYDELYFGKPAADLYVDDKAITAVDLTQIRNAIDQLVQEKDRFLPLDGMASKINTKLEAIVSEFEDV